MEHAHFERKTTKKSAEKILDHEEKGAIKSLAKSVEDLATKLENEIEKGDYELVIGDDTSGRLPALMFATVIKDVNESHGRAAPLLRFLTGSRSKYETPDIRDIRIKNVVEALGNIKKTFEKSGRRGRVLVVTDTIDKGETMSTLIEALHNYGFATEIAAISLLAGWRADTEDDASTRAKKFERQWGARIVWSQDHIHEIFRNRLSGVMKSDKGAYAVPNTFSDDKVRAVRAIALDYAHQISKRFIVADAIRSEE